MHSVTRFLVAASLSAAAGVAAAVPLNVINHSFEDDPNNFPGPAGEFFLGDPNAWTLIDPNGIAGGGDVQGTLTAPAGGTLRLSVRTGCAGGLRFARGIECVLSRISAIPDALLRSV